MQMLLYKSQIDSKGKSAARGRKQKPFSGACSARWLKVWDTSDVLLLRKIAGLGPCNFSLGRDSMD